MINPKLKEKIFPYLKMDLSNSYTDDELSALFNESYLLVADGKGLVCIHSPEADYLALMYNAMNGASEGIEFWELVIKEGKLI